MLCTESGCAKNLEVSHQDACTEVGERPGIRTCMLSLSDRQSLKVTMPGWFGARIVERDLPPKMREIDNSESTGLAYSCPRIPQQGKVPSIERRYWRTVYPCTLTSVRSSANCISSSNFSSFGPEAGLCVLTEERSVTNSSSSASR